MKKSLKETAAGGSVGAGSIAIRTDGGKGKSDSLLSFRSYLMDFNSRIANKFTGMKKIKPFPITVTEKFDLQDVLSRLSGMEGKKFDPKDTTTYGVEDDNGNIMKITVKASQASEFESALAAEMAEIQSSKQAGTSVKDVSMAELLYNLKDKYEIVDVQFPQIPSDVVYNADKATTNIPQQPESSDMGDGMDDMGDPMVGDDKLDLNDMDGDESDDGGMDELDLDDEGDDDDSEFDDDSVDEFGDDDEDELGSEGSILQSVISMLKAQAEAQTAAANAEAEKARALQAEHTARAASAEGRNSEDMMRMEAEMDNQKKREKEAKKMAELARYKVSKSQSFSESFVTEADEFESEQMLRRQKMQLNIKYKPEPEDDPETVQYKNKQKQFAMREVDAKIRQARERTKFRGNQNDKYSRERDEMQQREREQGGPPPGLPMAARPGMGF